VVALARGFGSSDGLTTCSVNGSGEPDECESLAEGAQVPPGSVLRTDGLTRARLEFADGTQVVLDRKSELRLAATQSRRALLRSGDAVFDVRHSSSSSPRSADADRGNLAVIELPLGRIEVLGTKFSVHVDDEGSRVDVSRGEVRLVDREDRDVAVAAGQSGRLDAGSPPFVSAVASLGDSFSWSERAFAHDEAADEAPRGLGELRAKKPGDKEEIRDAVVLTSHSVKVRLQEALARTEVEEEFTNQTDDRLEGILRFPLPPDAQIESLALEVNGHWEEGAFVDRERAAAIWRGAIVNSSKKPRPVHDEIVWVPGPWRDPALLEWQSGGRFELRIFPIEKRSSRRVRLSYTQKLPVSGGRVRYTYPLAHDPSGSTKVAKFDFEAEVRGHTGSILGRGYDFVGTGSNDEADVTRRVLSRANFVPNGDITLEYRLPDAGREVRAWAYREGSASNDSAPGGTVAISLRPKLPLSSERRQRAYVFVLDRSRSMYGERWSRAARLVERAIRELDRDALVKVLDCDSECSEFGSGFRAASDELGDDVARYLAGVEPEGASDLVASLRRAVAAGKDESSRDLEVVYLGDGAPTVGEVQPGLLREAVARVASDRVRISAVTVGAEADLGALRAITQAGGGVVVRFEPGESVTDAAFALLRATYGAALRDVQLTLPTELQDVSPRRFDNLLAGDELLVVAEMPKERIEGQARLSGRIGDQPFERSYDLSLLASASSGNAFVPRLFAATKIADLEQDTGTEARDRVVRLSQRFNVASRYTSLLVLESPAMFHAFGLDNQRSAPIWTGEVDATSSEAGDALAEQGESAQFDDEAEEALGTLGRGYDSSGSSSGYGAGRGASSGELSKAKKPSFAPAPAAPPRRAAPKRRAACNCAPNDLSCAMACSSEGSLDERSRDNWPGARPQEPSDALPVEPVRPPPPPRRRMVPMRKVWERVGNISTQYVQGMLDDGQVAERRARFDANPLSREALKDLYAAYLLRGDLEQAEELATRWSEKDPLDPDALTARADLAAERGDRKLALRILGSVVDVRPADHQALFRLARAYRWAGERERGCRYALSDAQRRSSDPKTVAAAVRCLRDSGESAVADEVLRAVPSDARERVDRLLASADVDGDALSGDFRVEATWQGEGGQDLDLVIVHPDGYRVSWLGAPTHAVISATDVSSNGREGLALRGAKPGTYAVEVVRSSAPAGGSSPVRGQLVISVGKQSRTLPFTVDDTRARVATVRISMRSRLVPL
jgi:tetratricopeptide (TPR) repeat protein/Mg-chelatase subunit ChlD